MMDNPDLDTRVTDLERVVFMLIVVTFILVGFMVYLLW